MGVKEDFDLYNHNSEVYLKRVAEYARKLSWDSWADWIIQDRAPDTGAVVFFMQHIFDALGQATSLKEAFVLDLMGTTTIVKLVGYPANGSPGDPMAHAMLNTLMVAKETALSKLFNA